MDLNDALIRHQYDEAYPIRFSLIPDRLVNSAYCGDLAASLLQLGNGKWEQIKATPKSYKSIPEQPGIYMFVWRMCFPFHFDDGVKFLSVVLYIGKAGDWSGRGTLRSRYKSEYAKIVNCDAENLWVRNEMASRRDRLHKVLNLNELEYWFFVSDKCEDYSVIEALEDKLIKVFNPPGNHRGARAKLGKTGNAF